MTNKASKPETTAERLREEALELLDYPAVRDGVAGCTTFFAARVLADGLRPSYLDEEVDLLLRETAEGMRFLEETADVDLHAEEDVSPFIARAALEGLLSGQELMFIADVLDVMRRARASIDRIGDSVPLLAEIAGGIPSLDLVQRQIRSSIGIRGEVLDAASPLLGPLRRQVTAAYQRVVAGLARVVQSTAESEALQDDVISVRGDRLVVQVKAEMRQRIPGVVHDASNTGATLFVEPFATVDLCNTWRELALEEERETKRVLRELSGMIGDLADDLRLGIALTARLDLVLARARYSVRVGGKPVAPPTESPTAASAASLRLLGAHHPLLGDEAIPIDIGIGPDWSVLVITGPNTGGKTVAMKTVGLMALMHQSGLMVSADAGSFLPVFDGIYADVGDHQSIERAVSRFGAHMKNVIDILSVVGRGSLVLLDELATSTDAEEGAALAKAILESLARREIAAVATTHHRTVAAHAEATPGMMNASVELDPDTLGPTYHLTVGVPGRSYAMSVASGLGLPADVIENARSLLEPQHLRFEDWLNELQKERQVLQQRLHEAEKARADAEASGREQQASLEDLAQRRNDMVRTMRGELATEYEAVRRKLRRAEATLSWEVPDRGSHEIEVGEASAELADVEEQIIEFERRQTAPPQAPTEGPLAVGDTVDLRGLGLRGQIVALPQGAAEAEVAIGGARLRLSLSRLAPAPVSDPGSAPVGVRYDLGPALATVELDLRGWRAEEALIEVEEFLDKALRDGLSSVRIIHGKGTGALRRAVRDLLERHPLAQSFESEAGERGGDGATVVELT